MNATEIAYKFIGLDASGLAVKGQSINNSLTGNTNYLSVVPFLGILQTNVNNVNAAIAAGGSTPTPAQTAAIRAAVKELKRILKVIGALVNWDANADEAKLLTSGFNLKIITPPSKKTFTATLGKLSGEVVLELNSFGIAAYNWEMSTDPISTWASIALTTYSKTVVTGLTPGQKYWFRVSVTKGKKVVVVSDPYYIMVV